jgi:hypothetical protein
MTLQLLLSEFPEFPYIRGKFILFFISVATVHLAADHAEDDDIGQARPSHNAAPLRPNQNSLFSFFTIAK